jgi:hypothetical protein
MQRREFAKIAAAAPAALAGTAGAHTAERRRDENEVYELRRYEVLFGRPQADLESYFRDALIPALNRVGISHVGVFTEYAMSMPTYLYVLIVHPDVEGFYAIPSRLGSDAAFVNASRSFESKSSQDAVYARYDTWLLRAFDGHRKLAAPDTSAERIFELRTYEGHNDAAVDRKVAMFNNDEIDLFHRTGLNPVFFGRMLAGPRMPALTYMLTFRDMAERDANWADFSGHPDWATMRVKPEYADTVSNIIRVFLRPTRYSQI